MITFENCDCMEALRKFPDKFFDLAIVDPPYGDANGGNPERFTKDSRFERYKRPFERGGCGHNKYGHNIIKWDVAPPREYFDELFRVSRNQIIWGGNYFDLPPTRCFVVLRKTNIPAKNFTMAPIEYAWTSFTRNAVLIEENTAGNRNYIRFHPTQKPVALYKELLYQFAEKGDKILDTHVGSGSSLIACYDMGFDVWGYEIDPDYYSKAKARLEEEQAQIRLF